MTANDDFRILYHSAPPTANTGYGVHTRHLATRLHGDFHVDVHAVGGIDGMGIDWDGIQVYPPGGGDHGEQSIPYWYQESDADVVFSHHDHWSMVNPLRPQQQRGIPMVLYTILDHDLPGKKPPEAVVNVNEHAHHTVVMSEWAEDRLTRSRIPEDEVTQIPHGVDTSKYAPVTDSISDAELKRDLGIPEDAFLFGMVAANYGPRKNIPLHMHAFKEFVDEYDADDAYLYIHTLPEMTGGYDLYEIRDVLGLDPERCRLPDGHQVYHGIEDLVIVQLYNTFDVHLNATQSESWGLTVTEAMSCGTPVIAANNSAMTEQFGIHYDTTVPEDDPYLVTNQGLLVDRGNALWTQNASARRYIPHVEDIKEAMAFYYEHQDAIDEHGQNARDWVVDNYQWDDLYENDWKPLFDQIKEDLTGEYNEYYFKKREAETQSEAFMKESHEVALRARGESVIDVGAGTGKLAKHLMEHDFDVTAVEYADAGVEYIREERENDIETYQGDIRDLQFKDDSFDTAVSQHVLEHIEADANALKELVRVARQKVICVVPSNQNPGFDSTEERRYDEQELDRLQADFEALYDDAPEFSYEQVDVTGNADYNWIIEVDLDE